jgi:hypothetical protein
LLITQDFTTWSLVIASLYLQPILFKHISPTFTNYPVNSNKMSATQAAKRVFLVTGASAGIGTEIARGIGKQGHHVILAVRNHEKGLQTIKDLGNLNLIFCPY